MKVPNLPDFPPEHVFQNVMTAAVIKERIVGFTKFFKELIALPPNPQVNAVCLRFLRNTFKREEAAQD